MSDNVPVTTQQAFPRRASWRTFVQAALGYLVAVGLVAPLALQIVQEELGDKLPAAWLAWLAGAVGLVASLSAAAARIMAIPKVDRWLRKVGLSSAPKE